MKGVAEAAQEIARLAVPRPPPTAGRFLPIGLPPAAGSCRAVDGSHAVLVDNGSLWVVATRVAAVAWPGPRRIPADPTLHVARPEQAEDQVAALYARLGAEPPAVRSAEVYAQAIRAAEETAVAIEAAREAGSGGLLLVDGALRGLPPVPQTLADRVVEAAASAGATVVGVSKRSAVADADGPLVQRLQESGPPGRWAVELEPGVFVARLHPRARHAFRVDAPDLAALARAAAFCDDAVYPGYPYPLALAHNAVAITAQEARDLASRLSDEVRRVGGPEAAAALRDFHEVLDVNI